MSLFDYQATGSDGNRVSGRIEAANSDTARRRLAEQGLTVTELSLVAEVSEPAAIHPLSADESEQFASHVAQFGGTGLPLEAGLRAAAAEVDNPRIARALQYLAGQLAQGMPLQAAVVAPDCPLPEHVGGLIATASRTGRLGAALAELLDHQHEARTLYREVIRGFSYPLFVVSVASTVILIIMFGVSGVFQEMFTDFDLQLPLPTQLLFWWRDVGLWLLVVAVAGTVAVALLVRKIVGPAAWLRCLATMPVAGRVSFWSGLAEWTGLMGVLIHQDVPMPEALRLSAGGVRNAYVGSIASALAAEAERGSSFSEAMANNGHVPASLVPVVRWGERTGSLAEALAAIRELLSRRVRVRALVIRAVMPPVIFILIICQVGAMLMALFMPLFSLIQGLS